MNFGLIFTLQWGMVLRIEDSDVDNIFLSQNWIKLEKL